MKKRKDRNIKIFQIQMICIVQSLYFIESKTESRDMSKVTKLIDDMESVRNRNSISNKI